MIEGPQQDKPALPGEERVAHLVRIAAREFGRALQSRLGAHEVTFGQWVFLRILWGQDGLSQRELSVLANLTEPTTHTALLRLEALDYVTRRNLNGNRRRQHVFLTDKGRAMREVLEPLAIDVNEVALEGLDAETQNTLRHAILKVISNLARDEQVGLEQGRRMPPTRARVQA